MLVEASSLELFAIPGIANLQAFVKRLYIIISGTAGVLRIFFIRKLQMETMRLFPNPAGPVAGIYPGCLFLNH